jgi:hypothetical protein
MPGPTGPQQPWIWLFGFVYGFDLPLLNVVDGCHALIDGFL